MSVLVRNRRPSTRLKAILKAQELANHTITITKNQKTFPAETGGTALVDKIVGLATDIYLFSYKANTINVKTIDDWNKRSKLQMDALDDCDSLDKLIELCHSVYHLNSKRVKYWLSLVYETGALINSWHKKDMERYSTLGM